MPSAMDGAGGGEDDARGQCHRGSRRILARHRQIELRPPRRTSPRHGAVERRAGDDERSRRAPRQAGRRARVGGSKEGHWRGGRRRRGGGLRPAQRRGREDRRRMPACVRWGRASSRPTLERDGGSPPVRESEEEMPQGACRLRRRPLLRATARRRGASPHREELRLGGPAGRPR
jgi:hypothetical protein